jgi:4-alpha-glucanotransferase
VQGQDDLRELARLYGVETAYRDLSGACREASPAALLAVLRVLDAPFDDGDPGTSVAAALAARRRELAERLIEPVVVAWDGRGVAPLRVAGDAGVEVWLRLENGREHAFHAAAGQLEPLPPAPEGTPRWGLRLSELPPGYHRLAVTTGGARAEATVISAPSRAWEGDGERLWGVFLPLYALRTRSNWGVGDCSDLKALADWTADLGGGVVGTLPLLAAFLDQPFEPSPYGPASRLFWNELYLDPRALPELALAPAVQRFLDSPELAARVEALRGGELVDYEGVITLKRRVLEDLAHAFFARAGAEREELERFVRRRPEVETWAAFRAVGDRRGEPWQCWSERLREGSLAAADYDREDFRFHLWVQWAAERQVSALAAEARRRGPGLYLDLPVGVHGSAYDVWRERGLFAVGAAAGAPPDPFFVRGQAWGTPPLKPEALREQGYGYLIACLRHHLEHAGILRIDHVMQLERLFWVPDGFPAAEGVYVRYPSDEMFAVLCLESQRHRALIVGENLGTVPPEVNEAMERHGILGMYVLQYELAPGAPGLARTPPAATVASLNTHDMPTFTAFWEGLDIADRQALGQLDEAQARAEYERLAELRRQLLELVGQREGGAAPADAQHVVRTLLEHLAASPARLLLVNLEDLWVETRPQNVPGTSGERPNWRRKARLSLEEFSTDPEMVATLRRIDALRRQRKG